jgi:multisubunit Na+/H+ antiporter MnhG subunit
MKLDIRLPIGLIFILIGAIIAIYGLTSNPEIYKRSLDININLWWGIVMFLFGVFMLLLAWRASRRSA